MPRGNLANFGSKKAPPFRPGQRPPQSMEEEFYRAAGIQVPTKSPKKK